jgi:hypothetical protein
MWWLCIHQGAKHHLPPAWGLGLSFVQDGLNLLILQVVL